jgi:hypothetical protein
LVRRLKKEKIVIGRDLFGQKAKRNTIVDECLNVARKEWIGIGEHVEDD